MGFMLAAGFARRLEFFAQALQKSLVTAASVTNAQTKKSPPGGGLKVQGET
jgi:hypothetical protein